MLKAIRKDPKDFVQLTRGYLKDLRELAKRSPAAHQILWLLTERMNKTNAVVMTHKTMGQILGYSPATIYRAVGLLAEEKWVQIVKIGTAHGYIVNSKLVWRDRDGKRYASFYAEIITSEDEQAHPIEDWDEIELRQVPILQPGERPVLSNDEVPPPDQQDLLPPDAVEFPRAGADAQDREKLEAKGQQRLLKD